jgi:hypothetical protein
MKVCSLFFPLVCVLGAQSLPVPGQIPADKLAPDAVVAKVDGGKDVTVAEIRALLQNEPPQVIQGFLQDPSGVLGRLLMVRELVAEGEKEGIAEKSPLKEQLEQMRVQALATGMVNYISNSFPVDNGDVKAFYDKNQSRYEQARIKAILVKFKPGVGPVAGAVPSTADLARMAVEAAHTTIQRSEEEAKSRAMEVVQKIRGGGDFGKLAAEYSDDEASKSAGGEFGVVTQTGSYPDSVKKAVFALKAGDLSDPIRESSGFYVIQVIEKTYQPMNELIGPITAEIRQNHVNEWFTQLTARFQPTIQNKEFFMHPDRALGLKPGNAGAGGPKPDAPSGLK